MAVLGVQARYVFVASAACLEKEVSVLHANFLNGLKAVGREAGANHLYRGDALAGQILQRLVSVGLQPFLPAKTRLEGGDHLALRQL